MNDAEPATVFSGPHRPTQCPHGGCEVCSPIEPASPGTFAVGQFVMVGDHAGIVTHVRSLRPTPAARSFGLLVRAIVEEPAGSETFYVARDLTGDDLSHVWPIPDGELDNVEPSALRDLIFRAVRDAADLTEAESTERTCSQCGSDRAGTCERCSF